MQNWQGNLAKQVINSLVVAGITALSSIPTVGDVNWRQVLLAFGMTFLVELRRYLPNSEKGGTP